MGVSIRAPTLFFRFASDLDHTVFKLPVELLFEIFSHFDHHRRYIRDSENIFYAAVMRTEHVEQSTVIRKLTMTCWALRDALLPVLWKNTEGCVVEPPSGSDHTRKTYGLYDQCIYLLSNPTSAAYVQYVRSYLRSNSTHNPSLAGSCLWIYPSRTPRRI